MPAPVRLRAHHLLCVLAFVGKGYTPEFIANQTAIVERMNKGAAFTLVEGIDDICAALHDAEGAVCESGEHCLKESARQRDQLALSSINAALGMKMETGSTVNLSPDHYVRMRKLFADGTLRTACAGCEWHGLCTGIAADGFRNTRLH